MISILNKCDWGLFYFILCTLASRGRTRVPQGCTERDGGGAGDWGWMDMRLGPFGKPRPFFGSRNWWNDHMTFVPMYSSLTWMGNANQCTAENRLLVTDEPVRFARLPVQYQNSLFSTCTSEYQDGNAREMNTLMPHTIFFDIMLFHSAFSGEVRWTICDTVLAALLLQLWNCDVTTKDFKDWTMMMTVVQVGCRLWDTWSFKMFTRYRELLFN